VPANGIIHGLGASPPRGRKETNGADYVEGGERGGVVAQSSRVGGETRWHRCSEASRAPVAARRSERILAACTPDRHHHAVEWRMLARSAPELLLGDGLGTLASTSPTFVEDSPLGTAGSVKNGAGISRRAFIVISGRRPHRHRPGRGDAVHKEKARRRPSCDLVANRWNRRRDHQPRRNHQALPREALLGRGLLRPGEYRDLRDRARGARLLPPATVVDWKQRCLPQDADQRHAALRFSGARILCDIGNIQTYYQANWDALEGRVDVEIPGERRYGNVWIGENVEIGYDVKINGPAYIGNECKLKAASSSMGRSASGIFSVIDENTKISNSIIWSYSYIGETRGCARRSSAARQPSKTAAYSRKEP